jgi:hypothetical protein
MKKSNNFLYVSTPIVQRYNASYAWVFAHVAYFACRGGFDTKKSWPSLVKKITGVGINTYKNALEIFVNDEILIKNDSVYTFNNENIAFDDVFDSYKLQFDNSYNEKKNSATLPLVELDPHAIDEKNKSGKKAAHERLVVTVEALALNSAARKKEFDKQTPEFEISSYKWLAAELGCDWRTIKSVIETIKNARLTFDQMRRDGKIVLILRKIHTMSKKIKNQIPIYNLKCNRYSAALKRSVAAFYRRKATT